MLNREGRLIDSLFSRDNCSKFYNSGSYGNDRLVSTEWGIRICAFHIILSQSTVILYVSKI